MANSGAPEHFEADGNPSGGWERQKFQDLRDLSGICAKCRLARGDWGYKLKSSSPDVMPVPQ